jgi:hypothetical protein
LAVFLLDGFVITLIFGTRPLLQMELGGADEYKENCPEGHRDACFRPVRNTTGAFGFYMTMALGVGAAATACQSFVGAPRLVLWREASAGASTLAAFVSVNLADLPLQALGAVFFVAPPLMLVDLRGPADLYLCWAAGVVWSVFGVGYLVGCCFQTDVGLASLVATACAILVNLTGGYVPKVGEGAYWSYARWSARALNWIEKGVGFADDFPSGIDPACAANLDAVNGWQWSQQTPDEPRILREGDGCFRDWDGCGGGDRDPSCLESKFDAYSNKEHKDPDVAFDLAMLFALGLAMRVGAYIALVNVRRDRQR